MKIDIKENEKEVRRKKRLKIVEISKNNGFDEILSIFIKNISLYLIEGGKDA